MHQRILAVASSLQTLLYSSLLVLSKELTGAVSIQWNISTNISSAGIAQLGERQTEDLKVACSIHAHRNHIVFFIAKFCALLVNGPANTSSTSAPHTQPKRSIMGESCFFFFFFKLRDEIYMQK